jgi:histone-lysine N-methyltransferase SETMAR
MLIFVKTGWENFDHPPYGPDLAPSDFHLFPKMKEFLGGKQMAADEEVKEPVTNWLNGLAPDFYDEGIVKLVQRLENARITMGIHRKINICCI